MIGPYRNSLGLRNASTRPLKVIIEPWAEEYDLPPIQSCKVIAINDDRLPTFQVETTGDNLIVNVNEGGSTFEFWQGERMVARMPIRIPF
jgi:hypothetical protein